MNFSSFIQGVGSVFSHADKREDFDYGKFPWLHDPEGNKLELYQPL